MTQYVTNITLPKPSNLIFRFCPAWGGLLPGRKELYIGRCGGVPLHCLRLPLWVGGKIVTSLSGLKTLKKSAFKRSWLSYNSRWVPIPLKRDWSLLLWLQNSNVNQNAIDPKILATIKYPLSVFPGYLRRTTPGWPGIMVFWRSVPVLKPAGRRTG